MQKIDPMKLGIDLSKIKTIGIGAWGVNLVTIFVRMAMDLPLPDYLKVPTHKIQVWTLFLYQICSGQTASCPNVWLPEWDV